MGYRVRQTRLEDADELGRLHVIAWQRAFVGIFADDDLDALDPLERAESWRTRLAQIQEQADGAPSAHAIVAVDATDDLRLLGFCNFGLTRDLPAEPNVGEVFAIYAHPDHLGSGIGAALMSTAIATLATDGFHQATLWTPTGNARGREFYERGGWRLDGAAEPYRFGSTEVMEVRYRISLTSVMN